MNKHNIQKQAYMIIILYNQMTMMYKFYIAHKIKNT